MSSTLTTAGDLSATTQASTAYERLRSDVLSGRLQPERKLQMRFLMDAYATGQTPLREALNRLSAEGLVESRDQRGFYVAGISQSELVELTKTRCWVESIALTESMAAATPDWEEKLVIAHHRLSRTPRSLDPDRFEDNPEWERLHGAFHRTLIERCGSRPLIAFCRQLADRLYRYRQLSIRKVFTSRHVGDEHKAILDAVLEKNTDLACALLRTHFEKTADAVRGDLHLPRLISDSGVVVPL
jgi:DNA-binding GntR family transcriptional regulator